MLGGCPPGDPISSTGSLPWFKDSRPCPPSHGVLARMYQPQAALSALRDLASWPARTVPNHLPLVSLAGQGLVFSPCFFCISVFKKFKFPIVSEESQEGEAAGAAGGKRREEAGENSGGKRVEGTEEVRWWKEMKGRLGWGKVRGEPWETEAETGANGERAFPTVCFVGQEWQQSRLEPGSTCKFWISP